MYKIKHNNKTYLIKAKDEDEALCKLTEAMGSEQAITDALDPQVMEFLNYAKSLGLHAPKARGEDVYVWEGVSKDVVDKLDSKLPKSSSSTYSGTTYVVNL
jgi:hypothetical protein